MKNIIKNSATVAVAATALLLSVSALAQGQQRGMRGFGMGFGGPGGGSPVQLLNRTDVKTELKVTDDQSTKIAAIESDFRTKMRGAFQPGSDPATMRSNMEAMMKDEDAQVQQVLSADQWKRLKEIQVQLAGPEAITNPDTQKELGLSDDQVSQINDLQQKYQAAQMEIFQKVRDGSMDRSEVQPLAKKNKTTFDDSLTKILTADQQKKLTDLGGAKFTPTDKPGQGRNGGRRNGGGGGGAAAGGGN